MDRRSWSRRAPTRVDPVNRPGLATPAYPNSTPPEPWLRQAGVGVFLAALVAAILPVVGARAAEPAWPGSRDSLVLVWRSANRPAEVVDPQTGASRIFRAEPRLAARFGRFFEMDPRGGFFSGESAQDAVAAACKKTNQFTLESMIAPPDLQQTGPASIISFASAEACDFLLGQERDRLVLRLRTSAAGTDAATLADLGPLAAGRLQHVLINYQPGRLTCYRDGEAISVAPPVAGDFSAWKPARLTFGAGPGGERPWKGRIEGIALYNRFMEPTEAKARFGLAATMVKGRTPAERVTVEARLVAMTPTPNLASVAPYVRVLVAGEYEVEKVVEGRCDAKRILAAHWAILDSKVLPVVGTPGSRYRLVLERFDDHPELESERLVMTDVDGGLPLFVDTER